MADKDSQPRQSFVPLIPETERSQWFLCDQPLEAWLDHQPSGVQRGIPHLDDVRLLSARSARLHPHLHGDSDHYVSYKSHQGGLSVSYHILVSHKDILRVCLF